METRSTVQINALRPKVRRISRVPYAMIQDQGTISEYFENSFLRQPSPITSQRESATRVCMGPRPSLVRSEFPRFDGIILYQTFQGISGLFETGRIYVQPYDAVARYILNHKGILEVVVEGDYDHLPILAE